MMLHLTEVLRSHAQQRRAVDFWIAAHVVVNAGMKRVAVLVVPGFVGLVLVVDEDGRGTPVLLLARQVAATFKQKNILSGRCQLISEGAAARTGADNN